MSGLAIGIGLLVLVLVPALAIVAWKIFSTRIPWEELPGTPTVHFVAPHGVWPQEVESCYWKAREILCEQTIWGDPFVATALARVEIVVIDAEEWDDGTGSGQMVAGQSFGYRILTNRSMSSLLHECAHVLEWHLEGITDNKHEKWDLRGIARAADLYSLWLRERAA